MTDAIRDRVAEGWSRFSRNFQPGSIEYHPKRTAHEAVDEVAKAITLRGRPMRGPAPDAQAATRRGLERHDGECSKGRRTERTTSRRPREGEPAAESVRCSGQEVHQDRQGARFCHP
jgi:hypothetical protein